MSSFPCILLLPSFKCHLSSEVVLEHLLKNHRAYLNWKGGPVRAGTALYP